MLIIFIILWSKFVNNIDLIIVLLTPAYGNKAQPSKHSAIDRFSKFSMIFPFSFKNFHFSFNIFTEFNKINLFFEKRCLKIFRKSENAFYCRIKTGLAARGNEKSILCEARTSCILEVGPFSNRNGRFSLVSWWQLEFIEVHSRTSGDKFLTNFFSKKILSRLERN